MEANLKMQDIENFYGQADFLINGGILTELSQFLTMQNFKAIIAEPFDKDKMLNILDTTSGYVPESLTIPNTVSSLFRNIPVHQTIEMTYSEGNSKTWPGVLQIKSHDWEIYILFKSLLADPVRLIDKLRPYASVIRLWQIVRHVNDTEKKLSRLSYMILATKSTLASIFEPMPLQYFASFLRDAIKESLFPKNVFILKDDGKYLTVLCGQTENIPERKDIYAETLLTPSPVITSMKDPFELVLPVVEGDCRLFCVMQWNEQIDEQAMNFLELLGNLAVRAIAIGKLRLKSQKAEEGASAGNFTIMSLSNVIKVLRGAESQGKFVSLLIEIFMEHCHMQSCLLAIWNKLRNGYTLSERRTGQFRANIDQTLLPANGPIKSSAIAEEYYDLQETAPDEIFKSWGLGGCPWKEIMQETSMRYLFPLCDDNYLVGMISIGSGNVENSAALNKTQITSLHLIAEFAAYEFRRFEQA